MITVWSSQLKGAKLGLEFKVHKGAGAAMNGSMVKCDAAAVQNAAKYVNL